MSDVVVAPVPPRRNWLEWIIDRVLPGLLIPLLIWAAILAFTNWRFVVDQALLSPLPQGTILLLTQATGSGKCPTGFTYLDSVGVTPTTTDDRSKKQFEIIGGAGGILYPLICVKD